MPSKSKAQERFMMIASKDKDFAKKAGISQSTAKEWHDKDKKQGDKKLPKRVSKEDSLTATATLSGPHGFRDQ